MQEMERPFLPGSPTPQPLPLGRFLPPYFPGMVTAWLDEQVSGGQWLLDPTGSNPALALEAARAGYRVLAASNNPVLTFLLEVLASAPQAADFTSAVAELGALRRGTERLEVQLQALYETNCPNCGAASPALAFLWRKGESQPFARLVRCPACGAEGEFPVTAADLERLGRAGSDALHRSRALERVAPAGDEDRAAVEEAVKSYLPRPLYVLFTLINKTEGLPASAERKRLLTALLLSLCDEASSLWAYPAARTRPRQLTIPPVFRENNLWLGLEQAAPAWQLLDAPVPVTHYPEQPPPTGGICIYPGRLKNLLPLPEDFRPAASAAVLPRPNQAFWTLSAMWAGWLWGHEAVQPLKSAFDRRRYDWHWHAGALHSLFSALNSTFSPGFPIFALLPELAPGFLSATIAAAKAAGLRIEGFALRGDLEPGQLTLRTSQGTPSGLMTRIEKCCQDGIEEHLLRRGEPDDYLHLYAAAVLQAAYGCGLPVFQPQVKAETLDHVHMGVTKTLSERTFLKRYNGASANVESGEWWLMEDEEAEPPLADRVELEIEAALREQETVIFQRLEQRLLGRFPGLATPDPDLVRACLEAKGETMPDAPGIWRRRGGEPERAQVEHWLAELAGSLGLTNTAGELRLWQNRRGKMLYALAVIENAVFSPVVLAELPVPAEQCVLVYPESHANLTRFKLQRDARLAAAASGWRFLTSARLQHFLAGSELTLTRWEALLNNELPGPKPAEQMAMF